MIFFLQTLSERDCTLHFIILGYFSLIFPAPSTTDRSSSYLVYINKLIEIQNFHKRCLYWVNVLVFVLPLNTFYRANRFFFSIRSWVMLVLICLVLLALLPHEALSTLKQIKPCPGDTRGDRWVAFLFVLDCWLLMLCNSKISHLDKYAIRLRLILMSFELKIVNRKHRFAELALKIWADQVELNLKEFLREYSVAMVTCCT